MSWKSVFFLSLFSFQNLVSYSADWDLFRFNQRSYYNHHDNQANQLDVITIDSIRMSGAGEILYFRKKIEGVKCAVEHPEWLSGSWQSEWYGIDSLIRRNDTVFFVNPMWSTLPFYFLPKAGVGATWTVTSTFVNNDYNQIAISCISNEPEIFLGITDSVKTYTLTPNGSTSGQIPANSFVIKLSKNYGLIEYVPFFLFLRHDNVFDFFSERLIGIDDGMNKYGYTPPVFSDYFHLSPGDILSWERYVDPENIMLPDWQEYYRDSITQVLVSADSVIYTYDRIKLDSGGVFTTSVGQQEKYFRKGFENLFSTHQSWLGLGNNQLSGLYQPFNGDNLTLWERARFELAIDTLNMDTATYSGYYGYGYSVDTNTCEIYQVLDTGFDFDIDTKRGVTRYCYSNHGDDCKYLAGSKIGGVVTGNIYLMSVDESAEEKILIYPNPADSRLNIRFGSSTPFKVEIYNVVGELMKVGVTDGSGIDISGLEKGSYFIRICFEDKIYAARFIKN